MQPISRTFNESEIRKSYGKVAWFYDYWSKLTESKAAKRVVYLADILNGQQVLEIAVGTGVVFEQLLIRNTHGHTIGTDLSETMLSKARKKASKFDSSHFELIQADTHQLSFADDSFDVLINCFMIDLLPEKDFIPVLMEFHRVLRPGGKVVISTFSFGARPIHRFWGWIARHFPSLLTGCRPVSIRNYMVEAGFEIITTEQISQNSFPAEVTAARKSA